MRRLASMMFLISGLIGSTSPSAASPRHNRCPSAARVRINMRIFAHILLDQKNPEVAYTRFAADDMVQRNPPFGRDRDSTIRQWRTMTDRPTSTFRLLSIHVNGDDVDFRYLGQLAPGQRAEVSQHNRLRCGKIVEEMAEFKVLENTPSARHD